MALNKHLLEVVIKMRFCPESRRIEKSKGENWPAQNVSSVSKYGGQRKVIST